MIFQDKKLGFRTVRFETIVIYSIKGVVVTLLCHLCRDNINVKIRARITNAQFLQVFTCVCGTRNGLIESISINVCYPYGFVICD